MNLISRNRSLSMLYWLFALLLCLRLPGMAAEPEDPRIARDDAFPTSEATQYISGELTHVEHVNRTGIFRPDRKGTTPKKFWDLPHPFNLPPYAIVRYHGAPAELRDIPIGTHLHGEFYLSPEGNYEIKPPSFPNSPGIAFESQFQRAFRLEDDFSFYQRQGAAWEILAVDLENQSLTVERTSMENAEQKSTQSQTKGMTGEKQFRIEPDTRIWKGREIGRLEDLAPGQIVQLNLSWVTLLGTTYQKAVTETPDEGLCREIWIDEESRNVATEQQRRIHIGYQQRRGIPAHVDFTESIVGEGARGYVTVTLMAGLDPELYDAFQEKTSTSVWAVEPSLRSYENDSKGGGIEKVTRIENPPPGSSGIQIRMHMYEMLEGFRRGRTVRMAARSWTVPERPREERLWPSDVRVFQFGPQGVAGRAPHLTDVKK